MVNDRLRSLEKLTQTPLVICRTQVIWLFYGRKQAYVSCICDPQLSSIISTWITNYRRCSVSSCRAVNSAFYHHVTTAYMSGRKDIIQQTVTVVAIRPTPIGTTKQSCGSASHAEGTTTTLVDVLTKATCTFFERYLSNKGRLQKTTNEFGLSGQVVSVIIEQVCKAVIIFLKPE